MAVLEKEITTTSLDATTNKTDIMKWLITFIIPIVLWLIPMPLEDNIKMFLVLTTWAVVSWITVIIPVHVTGFILPCLYILFNVAPSEAIFAPWSNTVVWGTVALIMVGVAANNSGFSMRIAYKILLKVDSSLKGLIWGFAFAGIIMAFIITDSLTRTIIFTTIAIGICQALGIKLKSKEATALGLAAFCGMSGPSIGTLPAGNGLMINSVFRIAAGFDISYVQWFLHNFIPSIAWTVISVICIIKVLKVDKSKSFDAKEELKNRYQALGEITKREKCVFLTLILLVVNFVGAGYVGLDALLVAALFAPFLFLPGIEVLTADDFEKVDFKILFVMAGAMAIGTVAGSIGLVEILVQKVTPLIAGSGVKMVMGSFLFATLANFILTPLAIIFTFTELFVQMAITAGINPLPVAYALNFGTDIYVFPYEFAILLVAFSFGHMNYKDVVKVLLARSLAGLLIMALIVIPFWLLIGLI